MGERNSECATTGKLPSSKESHYAAGGVRGAARRKLPLRIQPGQPEAILATERTMLRGRDGGAGLAFGQPLWRCEPV